LFARRVTRYDTWRLPLCVAAAVLRTLPAGAADDSLDTVVVTATRLARDAYDTPASIDRVAIRSDGFGVNVADSLAAVPGLVARDRQNYAQDTQISVRGFGARSPFGIRGVRIYIDGIPATQPDGQGQVSHFNLATAERVEVLRGPFSSLYGNSSGGVIQLLTADGVGAPALQAGAAAGSAATWRLNAGSSGELDRLAYNVGVMRFVTDGTRGHSAAKRDSVQVKAAMSSSTGARLTLLGNYFNAPDAQDPLGLTQAQFAADPQQPAPVAVQFNTRKSVEQWQTGAIYDSAESGHGRLRMLGYAGDRSVLQYLAIPVATQSDPRHSGGVIDLGAQYLGGELRWSRDLALGTRDATLVTGINYDELRQQRRGYENFVGSTVGVAGALRRDERNDVRAFDQYLQVDWRLAERWSAISGLRHSRIGFISRDGYVRPGNPDDSGSVSYRATTPVVSLMFRARPQVNLYASYGLGFETPTFAELAYRSDGNAGLNLALRAARTRNFELGLKWRNDSGAHADLALYRSETERELVVVVNAGGRSAFANAGRTRRQGAELSLSAPLTSQWLAQLSYASLSAVVVDGYMTCTVVPCLTPAALVPAGSRIPGVPATTAFVELRWRHPTGWLASLDGRYSGAVMVNDVNAVRAPAFTLLNVSVGYNWLASHRALESFLRIENVADRRYVGSVIVNDANGRFYEPGPGRTLRVGLAARFM